jgi:hypothetical protein
VVGFRRPGIGVISHRIGTCTYHIGHGVWTYKIYSLLCQGITMISPISSDPSVSWPSLYHHLRRGSEVTLLLLSEMP